jgi:adenylate cyclase
MPPITRLRSPLLQSCIIALLICISTTLLSSFHMLDWLDARLGDWRIRTTARPGAYTDRIVTIIVDQNSLAEAESLFGVSWPWPRPIYSYILSFCQRANVKAVGFDIVFTEAGTYGVEDDTIFAAALSTPPPSVLALPLGRQGPNTTWPDGTAGLALPQNLPAGIRQAWQRATAAFPVPALAQAADVLGNVVASPDRDAVFRHIEPYTIFDNALAPGFGFALLHAAEPETVMTFRNNQLVLGDKRVPISPNGRVRLRYRGPSQTHRALNATAILQSELQLQEGTEPHIDPAGIAGTYVLIGLTAPGLMDLKPTPVGRTYPGVEVHATALDNLLSGDFYRDVPLTILASFAFLLAFTAAYAVRKCQQVFFSTIALPLFAIFPVAIACALDPLNLWLNAGQPLVAASLAVLTALTLNYATEGRQKRFIKNAFKQYLSPEVIDRLIQNPDALTLGGEERVMSIFFSDVQSFTSISETLRPQELTALLNEYLTAMTDIILASGGTIDKYEGDAIIAFWNAPLGQPDHANRAVRAAMACQQRLADMRPALENRYGQALYARIGINTGPVVVGNMGSNQRFDYTFLGDAGNIAARLEGINKQFGTYTLFSGATREQLPPDISMREIARVRVVGKSVPITLFEPITAMDTTIFDAARTHLYAGDFQQAANGYASLAAQDPVAANFLQRCRQYLQNPPAGWDGIITLTEK